MRFTFEESEFINAFLENANENTTKDEIINRIELARENTEEVELIKIADTIIKKIKELNPEVIKLMIKNFPISIYENY